MAETMTAQSKLVTGMRFEVEAGSGHHVTLDAAEHGGGHNEGFRPMELLLAGSAAHFEAKVVAHRLIAEIRGEEPSNGEATYDGEVMCFLETGHNRATQLVFNYEHPPRPSLYYHMEKQLFNRAYWHLVPQGLV